MPAAGGELTRPVPADFGRERANRYLRIAVATRFVTVAAIVVGAQFPQLRPSNLAVAYGVAAVEVSANLAYYILGRRGWPRWGFHLTGVVDLLAIAALVSVTGGAASPFVLIFALVLVFNGLFYGWPGFWSGTMLAVAAMVLAAAAAPEPVEFARVAPELAVLTGLGAFACWVGEHENRARSEINQAVHLNAVQAKQLQAIYETSSIIGTQVEAEALLETAVRRSHDIVREYWGSDVVTAISVFGRERDEILVLRIQGDSAEIGQNARIPISLVPKEFLEVMRRGRPFSLRGSDLPELTRVLDLPEQASYAVVPIRAGDELIGSLSVRSDRGALIEESALGPLETIANHIASALVRVRALEEERRERVQATALFELARELNAITSPEEVLERIAEAGVPLARVDAAAAGLLADDGISLDPNQWRVAGPPGEAEETLASLAPLQIREIRDAIEQGRTLEVTEKKSPEARLLAALMRSERCLVFPVASHGEPLGILCFGHADPDRPFNIRQYQVGEALATAAAVALDNARHHREKTLQVEELRELDHLKSDLVSTASHELRSPLTSIAGYASTLLRSGTNFTDDERREFLTIIDQQARQLARLIDELLTLSNVKEGRAALSLERVDLSRLVLDCVAAAKMRTDRHIFHTELAADLPPAVADESKLTEILTNLIDNAIKYSPRGGRITIGAKLAEREFRIWVSDEGVGISDAHLSQIFEKFYQVEGRPAAEGAGLGLYLVTQLVKAHAGRLWVESQEGRGSTFFLALPQRRASDRLVSAVE